MKAFKTTNSNDYSLDTVQQNISNFAAQLTGKSIIDGQLVQGINLLSAQVNSVNHGLGRAYLGWIVVRNNANSIIYEVAPGAQSARLIQLHATANTTVDLWVF